MPWFNIVIHSLQEIRKYYYCRPSHHCNMIILNNYDFTEWLYNIWILTFDLYGLLHIVYTQIIWSLVCLKLCTSWFGLWRLTPLSTIFQLYHGGQFLLVQETGELRENRWPVSSHCQTLSQNVVSNTPRQEREANSQL